jgi:hypothetical protein
MYLAKKDGEVVFDRDEQSLKDTYGVPGADMAVTFPQFVAAGGIARIIDGEIFLGKTDAEKRAEKEDEVRRERRRELEATVDRISGIRWEAIPEGQKEAWREYRQALLDITEQEGYPFSVIWPTAPQL